MDRVVVTLVRVTARPCALPRPVPRPPRGASPTPGPVGHRRGRGRACVRLALGTPGGGDGALPAWRAAPAAGRVRRGRGELPPGESSRPRSTARALLATARARTGRRGGDLDSSRPRGNP